MQVSKALLGFLVTVLLSTSTDLYPTNAATTGAAKVSSAMLAQADHNSYFFCNVDGRKGTVGYFFYSTIFPLPYPSDNDKTFARWGQQFKEYVESHYDVSKNNNETGGCWANSQQDKAEQNRQSLIDGHARSHHLEPREVQWKPTQTE
jgi:hypothetical protein